MGQSDEQSRPLHAMLGLETSDAALAKAEEQARTAADDPKAYTDHLTATQRGEIQFGMMWQSVRDWFSQNWPLVLAGPSPSAGSWR